MEVGTVYSEDLEFDLEEASHNLEEGKLALALVLRMGASGAFGPWEGTEGLH